MKKSRTAKTKKKRRETIYVILAFIVILIILYYGSFDDSNGNKLDRTKCPHKIEGNPNATLVIKYIDSPYCFWCKLEDRVLERVVAKKGNLFKLERYDIRHCLDIVNKYKFSGTPSFVFSIENGTKEYAQSGYIKDDIFYMIICKATGDCYVD